MGAAKLLKQAELAGVPLAVIDGKLRGKNLENLPSTARQQLREHRAEIIQLLSRQGQDSSCTAEEEIPVLLELNPCCLCGGVDFIHGHKGGFFCCECQPDARPGKRVKAGGRITTRDGNDSNDGKIPKVSTDRKKREPLPANALEWLQKHRAELKVAGWTAPELYRRNRATGIAWVEAWNKPAVRVRLTRNGAIEFRWLDLMGKPVFQSAWPESRNQAIRRVKK